MQKKIIILGIIILLLIPLGLFLYRTLHKPSQPLSRDLLVQKGLAIPFLPNNTSVKLMTTTYSLSGKVISLTPSKALKITLDTFPKTTFYAPLNVQVLQNVQGKITSVPLSTVKVGKHIAVIASYIYTVKTWQVIRLDLLPDSTSVSPTMTK